MVSDRSAREILCRSCGGAKLNEGDICPSCGIAMPTGAGDLNRDALPANVRNQLRLTGADPSQSLQSTRRHLRHARAYRFY